MRPMTDEIRDVDGDAHGGGIRLAGPDLMREMTDEMRALGGRLRAFDLDAFGVPPGAEPDEERDRLAAGALVRAGNILVSCLFEDTARLLTELETVADVPDQMIVLDDLPPAFAHLYTHVFAERFLIVAADVAAALHRPEWVPPGSVAERLALHLLIKTARASLEMAEVIDWADSDVVYEPLRAAAFDDRDHELLYELERRDLPSLLRTEDPDGVGTGLAHWFRPFRDDGYAHPFVRD